LEPFLKPPNPDSPEELRWRLPPWRGVCEAVLFLAFTIFFITYGLTPLFGGDGLGLVGADEPRYAQIAHEMLGRFDSAHTLKSKLSACVTPYLYGKPWLEKPALYYWRAMFVFQDFGVHDWVARLPSATFAFIMVALIYLHMRRFRPGGHLDAALITVACAGILGFSRGASTDMQMAAPLAIGLLGWYAWYETDSKFWLFDIYFFTGVATLAKGPVAPVLAITIVVAFAFLRREWSLLWRSIWWPGVLLYFAIVLPWFIAVQHQNPDFFRVFFLEHNLERFATDRYEHQHPFWYYLVVVLLALMPWTVISVRALIDGIRTSFCEWRIRHPMASWTSIWPYLASMWSFEGQINRASFWGRIILANVLGWFVFVFIRSTIEAEPIAILLRILFAVALIWLGIATQVKRWHDLDKSGWMVLLNFTFIFVPFAFIYLGFFKGKEDDDWEPTQPNASRPGEAFPEFLVLWALIPIVFFSFSESKLPGYILPSIPPITILTGDFIARRRQQGIRLWVLVSHATVCGVMTMVALLMPWFVAHGPQMPPLPALGVPQFFTFIREFIGDCIRVMPPWPALIAALVASLGAALLIIVVVKGFGAARLRLVTTMVLIVLVFYLYGIGPFFNIPAIGESKQVIHLLDRSYSARPLAEQLTASAPGVETVAVFRVRRDVEFGLSFYRNREVVNYTVKGVPERQHLLVAQVTGKGGVDLHTTAALEELLGDRHYEQLFNWPEQGLVVYMVGSR
jgi:4-amino-4-deoxy-L-arabinose transferase-like glycosyltransferase